MRGTSSRKATMSRSIAVDRVDLFREDDLGVGYGQDVATGDTPD